MAVFDISANVVSRPSAPYRIEWPLSELSTGGGLTVHNDRRGVYLLTVTTHSGSAWHSYHDCILAGARRGIFIPLYASWYIIWEVVHPA